MASPTDIANRALQKLGSQPIMSIDDSGRSADAMRNAYRTLRPAELRRHPWSFAMARASLAADEAAPAFGFDLSYTLPSDFLRLVEIDGLGWADLTDYRGRDRLWIVEGNRILTDEAAPLNIRYVADPGDVTGKFDPCFVEALACKLAAECCELLTQSAGKRQLAIAEYREAIVAARRMNAIEQASDLPPDDSWVIGRQ